MLDILQIKNISTKTCKSPFSWKKIRTTELSSFLKRLVSFIIGGNDGSNHLATTLILQSNGAVSAGPPLPNTLIYHCMVTRIDGMVIITGGWQSSNQRKVWIFNPNVFLGLFA